MIEELKPLSAAQVKAMLAQVNKMPEATASEVGLVDASDVIDMILNCADYDFIREEYNKCKKPQSFKNLDNFNKIGEKG